jgi:signal transduction histidine kinase/ActR/RegA family two-component response regulator
MSKQALFRPFLLVVVAAGGSALLVSLYHLPFQQLDWRFVFLTIVTAAVASRLSISIPNVQGEVTVADTLIFITMLLYGSEAAVLMAAADGLSSSLYVSKKARVWLFNSAQMICSTFLTAWIIRLCFGSFAIIYSQEYSIRMLGAICLLGLVQYVLNSGLVATYTALKTDRPIFATWRKSYLWTSISYFVGASAASVSVHVVKGVSVYAILIISPIVVIVYLTYKTYLKNVQASTEKAEQARRHVEELSHYIAEQERIREKFSHVEKMSALGELASGVAHDFNNTLAGILGRAQLMLRTVKDPAVEQGLNIIIKTAEDGANTVKRIQDFARQRRDHDFEHVAIDQLLIDVNEITRPRWKDRAQANNIHIRLDLEIHTHAFVMGHVSELREVLVNIVFNAVDAMPEGGILTLAARERDSFVEINVADTGTGMAPEVRSRVFDPFFTTKGKAGMGLGLAVCYGIVQRHQGVIEVQSEVARGTTFKITLPIAEAEPVPQTEVTPAPRLTLVANSHAPRILVVDDEDSVREVLADILISEGYDVTHAANGEEALRYFDAQKFKAVFTDVGMPGMSGWEFARAIRERDEQIPMAVITGWGEAVSSTEQEEAKVNWVVAKPFDLDRIVEIAQEIGEYHGIVTSAPLANVVAF